MLSNVQIGKIFIKLITTVIIIIYKAKDNPLPFTVFLMNFIDMQMQRWVSWKILSFLDAIKLFIGIQGIRIVRRINMIFWITM